MTQTRIWNYGDTFTSFRGTTVMGELHSPGVFSGYDVSVTDTDKISVSPGFLLLPSGIMVGEDVDLEFIIDPLPAAATVYTLTCRHTDVDIIGGQAALYALEVGEVSSSAILDGIPIAYIYYPGGSVPLEDYFIVPARKQTATATDAVALEPTSFLPPFSTSWLLAPSLGTNSSVADTYTAPDSYTTVAADGLAPAAPGYESSFVAIPVVSKALRPVSLSLRTRLATLNTSLLVSIMDTDGVAVTLASGSTIVAPTPITTAFTSSLVSIDPSSGVFTEGDIYTILLEFRVPALDAIDLQSLTVNYDPLP